jgi:hypothetical protein
MAEPLGLVRWDERWCVLLCAAASYRSCGRIDCEPREAVRTYGAAGYSPTLAQLGGGAAAGGGAGAAPTPLGSSGSSARRTSLNNAPSASRFSMYDDLPYMARLDPSHL